MKISEARREDLRKKELIVLLENASGRRLPAGSDLPTEPLPLEFDRQAQMDWVESKPTIIEAYLHARRGALPSGIEPAKKIVAEQKKELKAQVEKLGLVVKAEEDANRELFKDGGDLERGSEHLRREFRALTDIPQIESVQIEKDSLTVFTRELVVKTTSDGSHWAIGKWKIIIPKDGSFEKIRFLPVSPDAPTCEGWYHPHVQSCGQVCFGNALNDVLTALKQAEYDVAITYCLTVLEGGRIYDMRSDVTGGHGYEHRLKKLGRRVK